MKNTKNQKTKLIRKSTIEFLRFASSSAVDTVEVRYEGETIWLTQKLMARLFDVDVRTISEHIVNIFKSGELDDDSTIRKFRIVEKEGTREVSRNIDHYNLDAIVSVGYRVNSIMATEKNSHIVPISLAYLNKQFINQGA